MCCRPNVACASWFCFRLSRWDGRAGAIGYGPRVVEGLDFLVERLQLHRLELLQGWTVGEAGSIDAVYPLQDGVPQALGGSRWNYVEGWFE